MDPNDAVASTLEDVIAQLGNISSSRILPTPAPGTATLSDCMAINERQDRPPCELVDGVLVEKAMGYEASVVAITIATILRSFISKHRLGFVSGADGFFRLNTSTRGPDVAFLSRERLPGGRFPQELYPQLVPELVVEVLSPGNTQGEMNRKRLEYFENGVRLLWLVDCAHRTVAVYTSMAHVVVLGEEDTIDGDSVIKGFSARVKDFFADLDLLDSQL
jgi:Uma2 family endonuclease